MVLDFYPADVIFFRGSESMEMGADHSVSIIFPPPVSTILGALRTTILKQNNIRIRDYYKGSVDENILEVLGPAGGEAGFEVAGPLLVKKGEIFVPVPKIWLSSDRGTVEEKGPGIVVKEIVKAAPMDSPLIKVATGQPTWAYMTSAEMKSLDKYWVRATDLTKKGSVELHTLETFVEEEPRTGIARHKNTRTVREGHLYTFPFLRLKNDVYLKFLISRPLPVREKGILFLGGDRRFGHYRLGEFRNEFIAQGNSGLYMILNAMPVNPDLRKALVATGKIHTIGGWDLFKQFHKPLVPCFPAGSVFSSKIHSMMIQL